MKIDNLISQFICCMTCIPSTIWWRRLRNWEILSTIYETTGALPVVPLKVRWWITIYGTRIRGTTSLLYLMNVRALTGYIWMICQKKTEIMRQNSWMPLSGIIWFVKRTQETRNCSPSAFDVQGALRLLFRVSWNCLLKCNHQQPAVCRELFYA